MSLLVLFNIAGWKVADLIDYKRGKQRLKDLQKELQSMIRANATMQLPQAPPADTIINAALHRCRELPGCSPGPQRLGPESASTTTAFFAPLGIVA